MTLFRQTAGPRLRRASRSHQHFKLTHTDRRVFAFADLLAVRSAGMPLALVGVVHC
jgi:hypothetical protein